MTSVIYISSHFYFLIYKSMILLLNFPVAPYANNVSYKMQHKLINMEDNFVSVTDIGYQQSFTL